MTTVQIYEAPSRGASKTIFLPSVRRMPRGTCAQVGVSTSRRSRGRTSIDLRAIGPHGRVKTLFEFREGVFRPNSTTEDPGGFATPRVGGGRWVATVRWFVIALMVMVFAGGDALAGRERPRLDTALGFNVLLTDQGTLLRGVSLSWDGGDPYGSLAKVMPSEAALASLKTQFGLNTVHLYLEGDSSGNTNAPGVNAADCDLLVQRTEAAGLYLIITIGCNGENGTIHSLPWSLDFWKFYAPRYKDRPHVLYEAHNEPVRFSLNSWRDSDWDKQVTLYKAIRAAAPDTFILLGSFMGFAGDPRYGANYLRARGVSWSNAGFAHHGYESLSGIEQAISLMKTSAAYPALLCTEFWPGDTIGQGYNSMYESHFNGWMQFQWLGARNSDLLDFKSKITGAGTVWTPDDPTCTWPALGAVNLPTDGARVGLFNRGEGKFVSTGTANGGDATADRPSFAATGEDSFFIERAGDRRVRLKTSAGQYLRTVGPADSLTASALASSSRNVFEWLSLPNGDFALRAFGGGGHLVAVNPATGLLYPNVDNVHRAVANFRTTEAVGGPLTPLAGIPYRTTPIALPGVLQAEDYDRGGESVAYHDNTAGNTGGRYRTGEGVDLEACSEGGFNVAFLEAGEWIEYTVEVTQGPGDYLLVTRLATPNAGGTFHVEFNGKDVTGRLTAPRTGGWQAWTNLSTTVRLQPGIQIMRFWRDTGDDFNVNRFTFSATGTGGDLRIVSTGDDFGVKEGRFGFAITGSTGQRFTVEGATNPTSTEWSPLATNTLSEVPFYYSDSAWTNQSARYYRVRW